MYSTLRLFKGIQIRTRRLDLYNDTDERNIYFEKILKRTIPRGYILSMDILTNFNEPRINDMLNMVDSVYGIDADKLNNTFQSSWKKIQDSKMEDLVVEQIMHYMTTYGSKDMFKKGNISDTDYIYVPYKDLNVPQLDIEQFKFVFVKGYTSNELEEKVYRMTGSGMALKDETMTDLIDIMIGLGFDDTKLSLIKNKEIKIQMYLYLNLVPSNNIEFLRLLIYKTTGNTLIIKNPETIEKIKLSCLPVLELVNLFDKFVKKHGFEKLAEIFYRFKPLWLAFRKDNMLKARINKIRRLAIRHHDPMEDNYFDGIMYVMQRGYYNIAKENIDCFKLRLNELNIFRKIRLAYALNYNMNTENKSKLYRIRNGKAYAKEYEPIKFNTTDIAKRYFTILTDSITREISRNVASKKIFIPNYITYALPSTEKQFTGNMPSGSSVTIDKDMIFGVYWDNVDNTSIDLDLSMILPNGKIGWDRNYTDKEKAILFSGDMTDARNGATELFYVKQQREAYNLLVLNYYNYMKDLPVPFKILVAQEKPDDFKINYMINPNNILINVNSEINKKQKLLGLALIDNNKTKFVFCETYIGGNITSSYNDYMQHTRNYLFNFYKNSISLNEILVNAGAVVIDDKEKIKDCDIDLSPEKLEKDSILKLLVSDKQ